LRAGGCAHRRGVATAMFAVLALAACTGGTPDRGRAQRPAAAPAVGPRPPAGASLQFAVAAAPIDCQEPGAADRPCRVGGSAVAERFGKLRLYHQVQLGSPGDDGCAGATLEGSLSGPRWSVPMTGEGRWCGREATLRYRFGGAHGGTGTLSYRRSPLGSATETLSGQLPRPPAGAARAAAAVDRPAPSTGCGKPPPLPAGRSGDLTVAADPALAGGATRRGYRVHVPTGYRPGTALPALLFFHGSGGGAADSDATSGFSRLADQRGFLAVYPQGLGDPGHASWAHEGRINDGVDDLAYTVDVLDDLQRRLCVDQARIYAGGFSAGGGMTNWLACELAGRIAAFASISGGFSTEPGGCRPSRPASILDLHNTGDPIVAYAGAPASNDWPFRVPAVPTWLAQWAERDGCPADPGVFLSGRTVTGTRWSGCHGGAELVAYSIVAATHSVPSTVAGKPVKGLVWDFLSGHRIH
jgi:polyhydroxybutyrate depolymerase